MKNLSDGMTRRKCVVPHAEKKQNAVIRARFFLQRGSLASIAAATAKLAADANKFKSLFVLAAKRLFI